MIMNDKIKELKDLLFELDSKHSVSVPDTQQNINDVAKKIVKLFAIPVVKNWVAVKDALPNNCNQVFVKYENGKYGINEWWESDDCWKYQFDNMIVKEWCKPPCS